MSGLGLSREELGFWTASGCPYFWNELYLQKKL